MGVDFNTGDSEAGAQVAGVGNSCGFSRIMAEKRTAAPVFLCFLFLGLENYLQNPDTRYPPNFATFSK